MTLVRMPVMTVRTYCLDWHGAAVGNLAVGILKLDGRVMNAEAGAQGVSLVL